MADDWCPDWIDEPMFRPVPDDQKDEFHQRVFDHMRESYGWGYSSDTRWPPVGGRPLRVTELICNTPIGPHWSRLWIANATGGLVTWVVGTGQHDAHESDRWRAAVDDALAALGDRVAVPWRAYLAQAPPQVPYMRFRLSAPIDLADGTTFSPGDGLVRTGCMSSIGNHLMAVDHVSALVRVDGVADCWSWQGDGEMAALRRLRLHAALLSLAWDSPWFVRDGPTDSVDSTWVDAEGPVSGTSYRWIDKLDHFMAPPPIELPEWLGEVEVPLDPGVVQRALVMHHEGLLMTRDHPSLAMIAFVSSIETMAALQGELKRCETRRAQTGSTQRFREAVGSVVSNLEAQELSRFYDVRSRTAHDGALHGREVIAGGSGPMSLYLPDEFMEFEYQTLRTVQAASRALIWRHMDLPGEPLDPLRRVDGTDKG